MYASQQRTNTKYTEFIRGYYPDPLKNVTTSNSLPTSPNIVDNNNGYDHFDSYSYPLKKHSIVDISGGGGGEEDHGEKIRDEVVDIHSHYTTTTTTNNFNFNLTPSIIGGKTKYGDIFDSSESPALRLKLLREAEKQFGGKTKVFSDSDLVLLHNKVVHSYQQLSPRILSAAPTTTQRTRQNTIIIGSHNNKLIAESAAVAAAAHAVAASVVGVPPSKDGDEENYGVKNSDLESVILHPLNHNIVPPDQHSQSLHLLAANEDHASSRGISDLESDLQKLNEETLRVLSRTRTRSNSTPKLEDLGPLISGAGIVAASAITGHHPHIGPGSGFKNHVSYQEILKAEHVALRRELLNNIREISRATFYEDLYTGIPNQKQKGGERPRAGQDAEGPPPPMMNEETGGGGGAGDGGENSSVKKTESAFHLNNLHPGTADPAERVDIWIKNSQEHLNQIAQEAAAAAAAASEKNSSANTNNNHTLDKKSSIILPENDNSPPLHASLYHDSIWADDENPAVVPPPPPPDENEEAAGSEHELVKDSDDDNVIIGLDQSNDNNIINDNVNDSSSSVKIPHQPFSSSDHENDVETKPLVIHNNIVIHNYDNEVSRVQAQVHDLPGGQEKLVVAIENSKKLTSSPNDPNPSSSRSRRNDVNNLQIVDNVHGGGGGDDDDEPVIFASAKYSDQKNPPPPFLSGHVDDPEEDEINKLPQYTVPHADSTTSLVNEKNEEENDGGGGYRSASKNSNNTFPKSTKTARSNSTSELDSVSQILDNNTTTTTAVMMIPSIKTNNHSSGSRRHFTKYSDYYRTNNNNNDFNTTKFASTTPATTTTNPIAFSNSLDLDSSTSSPRRLIDKKELPPAVVIPQATRERFPDRIYKPKINYRKKPLVKVDKGQEVVAKSEKISSTNNNSSKKVVASKIVATPNKPPAAAAATTTAAIDTTTTTSINSNDTSGSSFSHNNNNMKRLNTFSKVNDPPRKNHVIIQGDGHIPPGYIKNPKGSRGRIPGIIRRHNMDSWTAKKLYFFINGDEHFPKFEFRFRPQKDIKTLETLYDILSKRLNLDRGVRHIFTIDGQLIDRLEELRHENYYVVSSTKKFMKVITYSNHTL